MKLRHPCSATLTMIIFLALTGCSLIGSSEEGAGDGRSVDPDREIFVIHSLAETISSVELSADGTFGPVHSDIQYLGAVPNHIFRYEDELITTLSGQNELLRLDESTLVVTGRVGHGAGSNPMETIQLSPSQGTTNLAEGLLATTHLLAGRIRIDDLRNRSWSEPPPWIYSVGEAPQALLTLPGANSSELRLIVANTSFSTDGGGSSPFGRATLSSMVFRLTESSSAGSLEQISDETIDLEPLGFDPSSDSGTNPTALIDAPTLGEFLVIGSGLNYGADGTGADDGRLIVIDRNTSAIKGSYHIGGSPGAGVLVSEGSGHRLYLGGPTGIRSIYHEGTQWADGSRREFDATGSGGSLPFIADIAHCGNTIYAADFANNSVLAFEIGSDGILSRRGEVAVSQGPIALLVDLE